MIWMSTTSLQNLCHIILIQHFPLFPAQIRRISPWCCLLPSSRSSHSHNSTWGTFCLLSPTSHSISQGLHRSHMPLCLHRSLVGGRDVNNAGSRDSLERRLLLYPYHLLRPRLISDKEEWRAKALFLR